MYAVTSDPFTGTDLTAFIAEIWTPIVNNKTFDEAVLSNFCTDLSPYAAGNDIFHVPNLYTNALTVSTQSTSGAEITTAGPAQTDTTLNTNTLKYVAFIIGSKEIQHILPIYDAIGEYAKQAKGLLVEALEQDIAALWSSLTTNISITDTATVLSDAEIRTAIYTMEAGKYRLDECAFFFHPYTYWQQLHAIVKYYQQYSVGPGDQAGPVRTGNFGTAGYRLGYKGVLYGIPVYTTNNIVSGLLTHRNLLLHKSAFGFAVATQGGGMVRAQVSNEVRNLGTLGVFDILYGVAILREEAAVLLNSSNAFVGS